MVIVGYWQGSAAKEQELEVGKISNIRGRKNENSVEESELEIIRENQEKFAHTVSSQNEKIQL